MLIINKDSVTAIRQKLDDRGKMKEVIDDVRRMLEIKQTLLWRSDVAAPCCGSLGCITSQLTHELNILESTLAALENGDGMQADSLLEEYLNAIETSNEPSHSQYC